MSVGLTTLLLLVSMLLLLAAGIPFAFCIGGVALLFTPLLWGVGGFYMVATQTLGTMRSTVLLHGICCYGRNKWGSYGYYGAHSFALHAKAQLR